MGANLPALEIGRALYAESAFAMRGNPPLHPDLWVISLIVLAQSF
jgi:hypothetical protein